MTYEGKDEFSIGDTVFNSIKQNDVSDKKGGEQWDHGMIGPQYVLFLKAGGI